MKSRKSKSSATPRDPKNPKQSRLLRALGPGLITGAADDDPSRAGFEILWRETTDPRWQVYEFVSSAGDTELTGVSTDNHFFALRSVGKNGARSIAVPAATGKRLPPRSANDQR